MENFTDLCIRAYEYASGTSLVASTSEFCTRGIQTITTQIYLQYLFDAGIIIGTIYLFHVIFIKHA